jgi:diguanylate cyclase (GGDEF)-like protein
MTSEPDQPRPTVQSGARSSPSNGAISSAAAQPIPGRADGSGNGRAPAALLGNSSLPAPANALGDPLYRRLSVENRRLAVRLRSLEADLSALRRALTRATSDALTDPLTGLANRRAFDDALGAAAARACAASPAQLLIADIDHFKALNDAHGHHFGDAVLRITGEVLKAAVRRDTLVARLGGDEFALLLPGAIAHYLVRIETVAIARRLCARLAQRPLTVRGHPERRERITLSIGLAGWRPGESPADWYARADAALYAAKRGGRNQVAVAEPTRSCQPATRHPSTGGRVNDEDDRPADGERTYAPAQDHRAG